MTSPEDELLDRQLRAAFAPPRDEHFATMARAAAGSRQRLWPWLLAAAAAVLVAAFAFDAFRLGSARGPEGHDAQQLGALWVAAYDHAIETGFGVGSCCQQGHDLAAACEQFCGERLNFGGSESMSLLGCYGGLPTGGCLGLMLQAGGDPVCVFVVPRGRDPRPSLPSGEDRVLTRRELGPLVLYSLSHRPQQTVLAGFSLPGP